LDGTDGFLRSYASLYLTFFGTAAGCGVPSFFCGCVACQEALSDPRYQRSRCSVLVQGQKNTLIDTPPELRMQLIREKVNRIDHLLLTHWHYDHSGGLGDLEFYQRLQHKQVIPAYMTKETKTWMKTSFWFLEDCFDTTLIENGIDVAIDGIKYTALQVEHAPGTIGLLLETETGRRIAYIPDTGPLPANTMELIEGVDTFIIGATFWGRNWMPEDHLSVSEAVQIALQLKAKKTYLTHLSMHHDTPVTNAELENYLASFGDQFHLAYDGLRIEL
jgi:phosphoribosyl 1,2-cyclic phosphate phosphodiesterase